MGLTEFLRANGANGHGDMIGGECVDEPRVHDNEYWYGGCASSGGGAAL